MQSRAKSVAEYLTELPADRREMLEQVRNAILSCLPDGFEEGMQYGMIGYFVPHSVYPAGYHCKPEEPLPFVALASQKNYCAIYMMSLYSEEDSLEDFKAAWKATGKKLDMGKSCIRFKQVSDLALDLIAQHIANMPAKKYIQLYERTLKKGK